MHAQADVNATADILRAIPEARILEMQKALATVAHRFKWSSLPAFHHVAERLRASNTAHTSRGPTPSPETLNRTLTTLPADDALSTLMGWLYHKAVNRQGPQSV
jgi:hypothetical protein